MRSRNRPNTDCFWGYFPPIFCRRTQCWTLDCLSLWCISVNARLKWSHDRHRTNAKNDTRGNEALGETILRFFPLRSFFLIKSPTSSIPFSIRISSPMIVPSAIQIMTHKISAVSNALLNPIKWLRVPKRKSLLLWISRLFYFWRSPPPRFQEEPLPHFVLTEYGQGYLSSPSQYSRFCFAVLALAVTYRVSLP